MEKKQTSKLPATSNLCAASSQAQDKLYATPYLDNVTKERLWVALSVMKANKTQKEITIH